MREERKAMEGKPEKTKGAKWLWQRMNTAQRIMKDAESFGRFTKCMKNVHAVKVTVMHSPSRQSARYVGLDACGRASVCPYCAAKIAQKRQADLEKAIAKCRGRGGVVYMATFTISHTRHDRLEDLLQAQEKAMKYLRGGRKAQKINEDFGLIGTVTCKEFTWSPEAGHHPHCHVLYFFKGEIDEEAFAKTMRGYWEEGTKRAGLTVNEHGFRLDRTYGAVHAYVTKMGQRPAGQEWDAAAEMTKGYLKEGRRDKGLTPFQLLDLINEGSTELIPTFKEYAMAVHRKRLFVWSPGLRKELLDEVEEKSDAEIAAETELMDDEIPLVRLNRKEWSAILRKNLRGQLLEVARSGDVEAVRHYLISIILARDTEDAENLDDSANRAA